MVYHCCTRRFSLTHVHLHPDTHTHTQIVTHQSVFTTTPSVIAHASMVHTAMTYHHQQYSKPVKPMHDTTSCTAVRSPTSRHTHTYTDNHSTISIHNNTIGHSTCINGTHCYDIPSSTTHVNHGI